MNVPTRSKRFTLLFLSATFLLGMGLSYHRKHSPSFSLHVLPPSAEMKDEKDFEMSKRISLREGKEEDFIRLPRVGPELARRIIAFRKTHGFRKKEDLLRVKGIGPKTYEALEDLLVLE